MSKHVIFLVHGLGDFKEGWSEEISKVTIKAVKDDSRKTLDVATDQLEGF